MREIYLVTGNEKKWEEIQAILGDSIKLKRANLDGRLTILMDNNIYYYC